MSEPTDEDHQLNMLVALRKASCHLIRVKKQLGRRTCVGVSAKCDNFYEVTAIRMLANCLHMPFEEFRIQFLDEYQFIFKRVYKLQVANNDRAGALQASVTAGGCPGPANGDGQPICNQDMQ